ncbi:MAG: hypothetical protein ACO1N5_13340 [Noviherbaspirillum sp.]
MWSYFQYLSFYIGERDAENDPAGSRQLPLETISGQDADQMDGAQRQGSGAPFALFPLGAFCAAGMLQKAPHLSVLLF